MIELTLQWNILRSVYTTCIVTFLHYTHATEIISHDFTDDNLANSMQCINTACGTIEQLTSQSVHSDAMIAGHDMQTDLYDQNVAGIHEY